MEEHTLEEKVDLENLLLIPSDSYSNEGSIYDGAKKPNILLHTQIPNTNCKTDCKIKSNIEDNKEIR